MWKKLLEFKGKQVALTLSVGSGVLEMAGTLSVDEDTGAATLSMPSRREGTGRMIQDPRLGTITQESIPVPASVTYVDTEKLALVAFRVYTQTIEEASTELQRKDASSQGLITPAMLIPRGNPRS